MPSARITKTVWVASNNPMPSQTADIQYHRGDSNLCEPASILRNRTAWVGKWVKNAAKRRIHAADGVAFGGRFRHNTPHDQQGDCFHRDVRRASDLWRSC